MRRIAQIYRALPLVFLTSFTASGATAQQAAGWTSLSGDEIKSNLIGAVLDYPNAWQDFRGSGKTLYNAGADSWGNWRIDADRYCSQWPPRDLWDCYDVALRGDEVRFTDAFGEASIGVIRK